jgi:hypothetical protein
VRIEDAGDNWNVLFQVATAVHSRPSVNECSACAHSNAILSLSNVPPATQQYDSGSVCDPGWAGQPRVRIEDAGDNWNALFQDAVKAEESGDMLCGYRHRLLATLYRDFTAAAVM